MKPILFALLLVSSITKAQSIADNADALLTAYASQQKFSGNVLIAKKGTILFEKAYGFADLKNRVLNTTGTEFRVGSLTKMFTSAVILQLAASGKLSLTDPVATHIPGYPNGNEIQLVHLLSHTSGIQGHTAAQAPLTLEESVARFTAGSLAFTPGSRFQYNNFNYILLSYIAQKRTGLSFPELLRKNLLDKAGMTHTGLDTKARPSAAKALGYVTNPQSAHWEEAEEGDVALASGAGALYSTTGDLYRWSRALAGSALLPDSVLAAAQQPRHNNYGLGWMTTETNGRIQVGHTGSIPGFIASFMRFPKEGVTIILLANYQHTDGRGLSKALTALAFDEPYELPKQKKAVRLSMDILSRYVGHYEMANGFGISVTAGENRLFALAKGDTEKIELTAESERKFFLKGPEIEIEFIEEGGTVKYMLVNMQGGQKLTKQK